MKKNPLKKMGDMATNATDQVQNVAKSGANMAGDGMNMATNAGGTVMNAGKKSVNKLLAIGLPILLLIGGVIALLLLTGGGISKADLQTSLDKVNEIESSVDDLENIDPPTSSSNADDAVSQLRTQMDKWINLNSELDDTKGVTHKDVKEPYAEYLTAYKAQEESADSVIESAKIIPVLFECGEALQSTGSSSNVAVDEARGAANACKEDIKDLGNIKNQSFGQVISLTDNLMDDLLGFIDFAEDNGDSDAQAVEAALDDFLDKADQYEDDVNQIDFSEAEEATEKYEEEFDDLKDALQSAIDNA